jgi:hypothetical protein
MLIAGLTASSGGGSATAAGGIGVLDSGLTDVDVVLPDLLWSSAARTF